MGLRKYRRQIARARLTDMGIGAVNKNMTYHLLSQRDIIRGMRTRRGRALLAKIRSGNKQPPWIRVTVGDLRDTAEKVQRTKRMSEAERRPRRRITRLTGVKGV